MAPSPISVASTTQKNEEVAHYDPRIDMSERCESETVNQIEKRHPYTNDLKTLNVSEDIILGKKPPNGTGLVNLRSIKSN